MAEPNPPTDVATEVATAVRALMPGMRYLARVACLLIIAGGGIAVVAAFFFLNSGMDSAERWKFAILALFGGGLAGSLAYKWMVKRQESLVMPVLAATIGLSYSKDATPFVRALPKRLLPQRGICGGEDHLHGRLGAHMIQMSEVNVETGGKNSRTLFKGIVAQFPNRLMMPAFFIALEDKTRPGIFFGGEISTDGLHHLRNVSGGAGRTYGVWTSWSAMQEPPELAAVVDVLTRIEDHLGNGAQLYTATSNGEEIHVALSHKRNLFQVGGLFPNESDLFDDVRSAMQDLTVPLTLAKALIEAEEATMAKVKGR